MRMQSSILDPPLFDGIIKIQSYIVSLIPPTPFPNLYKPFLFHGITDLEGTSEEKKACKYLKQYCFSSFRNSNFSRLKKEDIFFSLKEWGMKYCMNTFKGKVRIAEISMEENRCGNQKQLSRRTVETEHLTDYRDLIINSTYNKYPNKFCEI